MFHVALINDGSEADSKAFPLIAQATLAHLRDFCSDHGYDDDCNVQVFPSVDGAPQGWIRALVKQTLDVDGALAFHDRDEEGNPIIYAGFADIPGGELFHGKNGDGASLVGELQHEIVETRPDPYANFWADLSVLDPSGSGKTFQQVAVETEDPIQETCETRTINGTVVDYTNYVLRAYFDPTVPPGTQLDRMGVLSKPGQIAPGGYIIGREVVSQDGQFFARAVRLDHPQVMQGWRAKKKQRKHSRTQRRLMKQICLGKL